MNQIVYQWKKRTWTQKIMLLLLLCVMAIFWPFCLFREDMPVDSGNGSFAQTTKLLPGMSTTQKFYAEKTHLKSIGYVLTFEEDQSQEGTFLFEVLDSEGSILFSYEVPYSCAEDYRYCDIYVDLALKKGKIYQYRLTNRNVTENIPCVVFTNEEAMHVRNNCGMIFGDELLPGEAMTRYTWSVPLDFRKILAYWGFMGMICFALIEVENLIREKFRQRESER